MNYSTATGMTDVIFDGYFKSAGLTITRVPYRDVVAPLTDLGGGSHPGLCRRARDRAAAYPGRPGQADRGHQQPACADASRICRRSRRRASRELTFDGLIGLFGPRNMPAALRDRIAADIKEVMADPTIASRFTATGQLVSPGTAAEFAKSIEEQQTQARRGRQAARRQAAVALNFATTSSGIGCARRPPGRLSSRTTQQRVSLPSTASAPSSVSRCCRLKLERPTLVIAVSISTSSPKRVGRRKRACALDRRIAARNRSARRACACASPAPARSAARSSGRTSRNSADRKRCRRDRNRPTRCAGCGGC